MSTAIKLRGDSTANWTSNNPVLLDREIAVDTTLNRFKIGNGTSTWSQLNFMDKSLEDALGLKATIDNPTGGQNNYAPISNPVFTGNVIMHTSAPVADYFTIDGDAGDILLNNDIGKAYSNSDLSADDSSNRIATTAFVNAQKNSPTLTGEPKSVTPTGSSDAKMIATKEYVDSLVLNGTNYLIVYGTGTPTENAAELQAAYEAAKNMPRYLGHFSDSETITFKAGQTASFGDDVQNIMFVVDGSMIMYETTGDEYVIITEAEAKSVRTTLIVAPGTYGFNSSFSVDASGINIVSLTGNRDITITHDVYLSKEYVHLKGIDTLTNRLQVVSGLSNYIIENCISGDDGFSAGNTLAGTYINCDGGLNNFAGDGGSLEGILIHCRLKSGTFPIPTGEGKIYNCIDGNGSVYNNVNGIMPHTKTDVYTNYTDEQLLELPDGIYNTWHGFYILQSSFDNATGVRTGSYQFRYSSSGMVYRKVDIDTPQIYPDFINFNNNISNYGSNLLEFADNAAASALLGIGEFYRTGDVVKVVHA
jgi:hypothetical protein